MSEAPSSRRGGPGGTKPKKQGERYQVLQKSLEDPTLEGPGTSAVWQPLDGSRRDPEALAYTETFDLNRNETVRDQEGLFDGDAEEIDFDQDWIQELNMPDEEDEDVLNLREFDFSAERGGKKTDEDKMLERQMKNYAMDADMDKDDPRAHGLESNVSLYKPALQEFLDDTRKVDFLGSDPELRDMDFFAPSPNEINPAVPRGMGDAVYHTQGDGVFLAVYSSQRSRNIAIEYRTGLQQSNQTVKQRIQENPEAALASDVDSDDLFESEEDKGPQYDAETILSTLTNVENRPGVIERRAGIQGLVSKKRKFKKRGPQVVEEAEPEELEADVADRLTALTATATSGRPKEETADEKRERKRLVKEGRLLKRQQKKGLKGAFREEETKQRITSTNTEMQKRTVPLGIR